MKHCVWLVLFVFFANCSKCDPIGGTRESGDKEYYGSPTATSPYNDEPVLSTQGQGCTTTGCTYSVMARVVLHNPLEANFTADVECEFWTEEYLAATNKRNGVVLRGRTSKAVEIQEMITLTQEGATKVRLICEVTFR